jgi:hypothetical protein
MAVYLLVRVMIFFRIKEIYLMRGNCARSLAGSLLSIKEKCHRSLIDFEIPAERLRLCLN